MYSPWGKFIKLVSFQINFSEKQSTFHWQRCSDLPVYAYDAQVVLLEKKVYFASEMETSPQYMYTYDVGNNLWQLLPSPAKRAALAVYGGKVVLAGGMIDDNTITNKVWVLQDDNTWNESLPPMPTARYGANFLIVVAGSVNVGHSSNTVEIYDGKQWMTLSHPTKIFYTPWSTCLNGFCFLLQRNRSVLYTSIQSLINDTTNGWKKLPFCSTIFAGTLLVVGGSIHMYYPLAQQWVSLYQIMIQCPSSIVHVLHRSHHKS